MKQTTRQKGGEQPVKKYILVEFDEETHQALKHRAVDEKTTMRAFIAAVVKAALEEKKVKK